MSSLCCAILMSLSAFSPLSNADWPFATLDGAEPIIIAHRGASGYLPEHTLPAYALAIEQGADFIEPDLVMTKDGRLVARHDRHLSQTTDVADHKAFADRKRESGGQRDWFVEDFTLEELKQLRARQPFPGRSTVYDGRFAIPTFDEILELRRKAEKRTGRKIGVYPETKHPSHFASAGLDMAAPLLEALKDAGYEERPFPVFVQSFEPVILRRLEARSDLDLILLVGAQGNAREAAATPAWPEGVTLEAAAEFADGLGVAKTLTVDPEGLETGLVARAHAHELAVHVWTLRDDSRPERYDSPAAEYAALFAAGIDGVFTDFPDTGVTQRWLVHLRGKTGLSEK